MNKKIRFIHPNFIVGLISYLALIVGIVSNASGAEIGDEIIVSSFIILGLHWALAIVDVSRDQMKKENEGLWYFWFASVLIIAPLGGMIYYMINDKRVSI